jgi:hypothetical protein
MPGSASGISAPQAERDRIAMAQRDADAAQIAERFARQCIASAERGGPRQRRHQQRRDHALEHVDQQHRDRETLALRAQRVGRTDVAAAELAQVDAAAQAADDLAAHEVAEQIGQHGLGEGFGHVRSRTARDGVLFALEFSPLARARRARLRSSRAEALKRPRCRSSRSSRAGNGPRKGARYRARAGARCSCA